MSAMDIFLGKDKVNRSNTELKEDVVTHEVKEETKGNKTKTKRYISASDIFEAETAGNYGDKVLEYKRISRISKKPRVNKEEYKINPAEDYKVTCAKGHDFMHTGTGAIECPICDLQKRIYALSILDKARIKHTITQSKSVKDKKDIEGQLKKTEICLLVKGGGSVDIVFGNKQEEDSNKEIIDLDKVNNEPYINFLYSNIIVKHNIICGENTLKVLNDKEDKKLETRETEAIVWGSINVESIYSKNIVDYIVIGDNSMEFRPRFRIVKRGDNFVVGRLSSKTSDYKQILSNTKFYELEEAQNQTDKYVKKLKKQQSIVIGAQSKEQKTKFKRLGNSVHELSKDKWENVKLMWAEDAESYVRYQCDKCHAVNDMKLDLYRNFARKGFSYRAKYCCRENAPKLNNGEKAVDVRTGREVTKLEKRRARCSSGHITIYQAASGIRCNPCRVVEKYEIFKVMEESGIGYTIVQHSWPRSFKGGHILEHLKTMVIYILGDDNQTIGVLLFADYTGSIIKKAEKNNWAYVKLDAARADDVNYWMEAINYIRGS